MSELAPGVSFRVFFNEGNINNRRYHVRAIVDGRQYVLRTWSRKWGGHWHYEVRDQEWVDVMGRYFTDVKPSAAPSTRTDESEGQ
jgi:hypothetical protein